MIRWTRVVGMVAALMLCCRTTTAELITFTLDVLETSVIQGQTVNWQLFTTVSNSTANNWGLAAVTANLTESTLDPLATASIGAPFSDYDFSSGGTPLGNQLIEITAAEFSQSNASTEARDVANGGTVPGLGPILFASGSYVVNTLGLHTLTPSAGSTERYFTAIGQALGTSTAFAPVDMTFVGDSFTVVAVPEPSVLALLVTALIPLGLARAKKRT